MYYLCPNKKKKMKNVIFTLMVLFSAVIVLTAQCTGLEIVGFSSDDPDRILLRATADIPGNTVFWLTNDEWVSATNSFDDLNEDEIFYTTPNTGLASGSTVLLNGSTATCGTLSGNMLGLGSSNSENIYLLDKVPSVAASSILPLNFCFSIAFGSGMDAGQLPPTNAIDLGNIDNAIYVSGSITNPASWTTSNSALTFPAANCAALPVKMMSYNLKKEGDNMLLSWTTTEEIKNSHFIVEHSLNGEQFTEIGKVEANFGRSENKDYTFIDTNPVSGLNYYRLVQYDLDGTSTKFDILSAEYTGDGQRYLYPTITDAQIFLSGFEDGLIQIFDSTGRKVLEKPYTQETGLDVSNFSKGLYYLTNGNVRFKFVKI